MHSCEEHAVLLFLCSHDHVWVIGHMVCKYQVGKDVLDDLEQILPNKLNSVCSFVSHDFQGSYVPLWAMRQMPHPSKKLIG